MTAPANDPAAPPADDKSTNAPDPTKTGGSKSLADLLAGSNLSEDDRKLILGQVSDANSEAAKYRTERNDARTNAAALKAKADQWDAGELAKLDEAQRATAERDAARAENDTLRANLVTSEISRLAADTFADPRDAVDSLKVADYIGADGKVDAAKIATDLAAKLTERPHWAKAPAVDPNAPRSPKPLPGQGTSGTGTGQEITTGTDRKSRDAQRADQLMQLAAGQGLGTPKS